MKFLRYHQAQALLKLSIGNAKCLCGKKDGWYIYELQDNGGGDCAPSGTGDFGFACSCGVNVPANILDKLCRIK